MSKIANKYFIKDSVNTTYVDITTKYQGLTLLKIDDLDKEGKAKNIFHQSWLNSSNEDVFIPAVVYFEQPDIDFTFIVKDSDNPNINVQSVHDAFIKYMRTTKVTIKSLYDDKEADFICIDDYAPTKKHIKRKPGHNYILGTLPMHRVTNTTDVTS